MNKIKPCPCGCKNVELKKYPLQDYKGCYKFIMECPNPNCYWVFYMPKNDTIYRSEEEAKKNVINAWNNRG